MEKTESVVSVHGLREVEDVEHFVLRYSGLIREREVLMKTRTEVVCRF